MAGTKVSTLCMATARYSYRNRCL